MSAAPLHIDTILHRVPDCEEHLQLFGDLTIDQKMPYFRCHDNTFQIALGGSSYSLLERMGAIVVGTAVTNVFINARKAVEKSDEVEIVPVLATSVGYGVYMAVSSNLRYQILAGVIEQRLLEPMLHQHKLLLSALCFAVRTGNIYLGGWTMPVGLVSKSDTWGHWESIRGVRCVDGYVYRLMEATAYSQPFKNLRRSS